jgi:hypothetical protein
VFWAPGGPSGILADLSMVVGGITPGPYACDDSTYLVGSLHNAPSCGGDPFSGYWSAGQPGGSCSITLDEVGGVGEMVRGSFEGLLVAEGDAAATGLGETWTLSNGTFEFVRQPDG